MFLPLAVALFAAAFAVLVEDNREAFCGQIVPCTAGK